MIHTEYYCDKPTICEAVIAQKVQHIQPLSLVSDHLAQSVG